MGLEIAHNGIDLSVISGRGKIKCYATGYYELPTEFTELTTVFPYVSFPGDGWKIKDVKVKVGIFTIVDLTVENNAGAGLNANGLVESSFTEEYGKFSLEPRQFPWGNNTFVSFDHWLNPPPDPWLLDATPRLAGPWISWSITFEDTVKHEDWGDAINPTMPAGIVAASGQLLCVDFRCTQNSEQQDRGVWFTQATFWIAPGNYNWKSRR